jgi:hypothetical protein
MQLIPVFVLFIIACFWKADADHALQKDDGK